MAVQTKALDLETRVDRLESELEMRRLIYEYCHGVDKRDLERFLDIWHDDAVWEIGPPFGNFYGKDAIRGALVDLIWPAWRETHHWTTNFVVDIDGDRAHGVCDVDCNGANPEDVALLVSATYTDDFERRDGEWRIARRQVVIHYFSPVPGVDLAPPPPME